MDIPEPDEAELRVGVTQMYKAGGVENVLACVIILQKSINIILSKLNEILDEEKMI